MAENRSNSSAVAGILAIVVVVIIAFIFFGAKDHRTGSEKVGDALTSLEKGHSASEAADQLKDRTPAEKAGDAASNAAHDVKEDFKDANK